MASVIFEDVELLSGIATCRVSTHYSCRFGPLRATADADLITKVAALGPDKPCMFTNPGLTFITLTVALIVLTLYIMRRRVRLGKRKGSF